MVSERALLPIKDARELLYRMLRARYLSLQVCRHASLPHLRLSFCSVQLPALQSVACILVPRTSGGALSGSMCQQQGTISVHRLSLMTLNRLVLSTVSGRKSNQLKLHVQDIPRATDHAPSKTFYTFRADTDAAFRTMQHDIVHALLNLRLRYQHEMKLQSEVNPRPPPFFSLLLVAARDSDNLSHNFFWLKSSNWRSFVGERPENMPFGGAICSACTCPARAVHTRRNNT